MTVNADREPDRTTLVQMIVRDVLWVLKYAALFGVLVASLPVLARYGISQIKFGDTQIELIDRTAGKVVDVSQDLKTAQAAIGELRLIVDKLTAERAGGYDTALKNEIQEYRLAQTSAVETSDRTTANLAKVQQEGGLAGYMWIGNFDKSSNQWKVVIVRDRGDREYAGQPKDIVQGQVYTVDTDVNVREDWPENTENYYQKLRVIGIANEGVKVRIVEPPRAYTRAGTVDSYWVRVEVLG